MATLIAFYDAGGHRVGHCGVRCYNAHHRRCNCVCGGVNHGAGERQAAENTARLAETWRRQARAAGHQVTRTVLGGPVVQLALF